MAQRIYTRTGDEGITGLFGGERVAKSAPRMEALGAVDETNCVLGAATAACPDAELRAILLLLQHELFCVGAQLGVKSGHFAATGFPRVRDENVAALERRIDEAESVLPPLTQFILPGGVPTAAYLHLARAVCRRAERAVVRLATEEPVEPVVMRYLNRLSDLLFVLARDANRRLGADETPWDPSCAS